MSVLLLGASGYIGRAFADELNRRKIKFESPPRRWIDYANFNTLSNYLRSLRPDLVINAAGYTGKPNVDVCEAHKSDTFQGNVRLPVSIAYACERGAIPWAHLSSGCLYNGAGPYTESDEPNFSFEHPPCSYYSGCKATAEKLISGVGRCYIWRLRLPFDGIDGQRNYLSKLMRYPKLLEATNSLSHRGDFVNACLDLWDNRAPFGTYNITNPGAVSTGEVAYMIRAAGLKHEFEFFKDDAEFYREAAIAPRSNCVLSVAKLLSFGVKMRCVQDALVDSLTRWNPEARLATPMIKG